MDAQEVKDRLKNVINNIIKDQPDDASKELHDVLAAKMRQRVMGDEPEETVDATAAGEGDEAGDGDEAGGDDTSGDEEVTA